MIWKWKWKRPAAFLLAAAMIFTMSGVPASAVETDVSGASGNAPAECICETHCEQGAVNPDCPVCAAEDADLSACKGTEQAMPLMTAAASTEKTISGNVTWNNQTITTPVVLGGDTTITLTGENTITITDTAYTAALDMYSANLTIQGSGSLTVTVPNGKEGIADGNYSDTAGGTLTIKDGAKITTNGGRNGLSAKTIVIENGNLNLNSGYGIDTASLTMNGGTLYATGRYGAISNSRYGNARNINNNLTILYSESQNAKTDDMSVGTAADTTREGDVKTIYIAKMAPRASLIVGAQQGTLQESLGRQTATFSVTGSRVKMDTLKMEWVGQPTGLTAVKSSDGATITVTADSTVREGSYKLKLTADSEKDFSPAKATATATVTVAAAPRNPITIRTQPQVVYEKLDGESVAVVDVSASLASSQSGNITYQWYVNGKEFQGTGSGSYNKIVLTKSNLTPVEGRDWEYSGQVYCKLSYNNYTVDTKTVTVTINTCTHAKYTHDGKCQQCGEPCREEVLFIDKDGLPYSSELDGGQAMIGSKLISGGTFYFVRDINAILRAGGDGTNKKDVTLDLQGHKVNALDLQNFPYNSVTIKNGTMGGDIGTNGPAVLILDSVTTGAEYFNNQFTLTVKGDCVFTHQMTFVGNTQLHGGTFQGGISVDTGAPALALLAEGYAFADTDDSEILNVSEVSIQSRSVKVVEHTCQYQNGKCVCGRSCDHAGKVDSAGYCTFCKALVEAFETGGTRYTSLENALNAAQDGDTITLRGPLTIENVEPIEISKNIILNLNGFTLSKSREEALLCILGSNVAITNGKVQSTCVSKSANAVEVGKFDHTGAKLTLDNVTLEGSVGGGTGVRGFGLFFLTGNEAVVTSGTFTGGIYTDGTLTMSGGSADLLQLGYNSGIRVILSGGSFDSIKIENGADYQSLLAAGYAYQKQDGAWVKLSEMNANTAVTVVECSHPDDPSGGNVCPYCGYAAEVTKTDGSTSYHRTVDAAIAAAGGGTVKLLANAGELTISSPLKLDLNGKTAAKLTVTGDVTLASLLPEGYAFKSGSTWISDLSSTELTNVSMAKIPIKSMNYPTEMSMTYGGAGTLLVTVAKETGTGAVNFQWYKVEDGKETAVGGATTKSQFDLYAQKLPAGQHTFHFSATCDGYEKMSKDIVVTVQKANIRSNLITPPTAQENLIYTGQKQALITAGSVADYGTMQYSLTENGTYSQNIPTGTDAGAYIVWYRVFGDDNHNDTAPASVAVRIGKKPLRITGVTAASKPYDGTTNANISSVTFDGVNLNRGTDYTVTANFDDAGVGSGKNVTATVTLTEQTAKNYALEQSSFPTTGSIIKAAAPDFTKETALTIVNDCEKTYTVTLPALPTLETPKEYGALTYEIGEIKLNDGYYTSGAKVENGKLTLPIQKNDVATTGSVGTATVVIKSTNYEDITLTVNVNATNQPSSGGGSSSSGSSGGSSGNSGGTNQPGSNKTDTPVTSETQPMKPDANGNAAVDNSSVQSAIDKAKQDAKKNGIAKNGIAVTVPITPAAGQTSLNVTIKAQTLDMLVKENVRQFTVATDYLVSVNIGLDTLKQLDSVSAGGDIILRADKVDALRSTEAKAAIGTRPAYDLSLVYLSGGKEIPITSLNGHTISVRLSYTPTKGEQTGNLYAVYVDDAGKVEWITKSSYDTSLKAVVFETGHFSVYGVGYKNPAPAFTDIHNHWAEDNILFAASRGLLSGTSATTFSPNTGMTRGMFVTALGRLAGINPDSYKTGKFTDVKADAYYAPYVNWAAQTGIVTGVTATTFAPDTNINREQMAVIMANYAKKLGYDLPQTLKAVTFADNANISSWAKDAVKAMQQAGILAGKVNNRFDPKGTATRAEVATVLRRFVEIVIDPQTANGWQQNDSGQWSYYRNGKPVKGLLSDDQKWYWLDKTTGMMFAGGWKQINGMWYYFYTDGTMAVNTTIDGYTIGSDGARK